MAARISLELQRPNVDCTVQLSTSDRNLDEELAFTPPNGRELAPTVVAALQSHQPRLEHKSAAAFAESDRSMWQPLWSQLRRLGRKTAKTADPADLEVSDGRVRALTADRERATLDDFRLLKSVGRGAFGRVRICELKSTREHFAIKYVDKRQCCLKGAAANVIRERKILQHIRHPLLCNLRFAFQTADHIFLVSDLMLGGDLRFHISRKTMSEDTIRHWIAEIGCALEYCHSRGIVHRDIKPDNILLDVDGHAHLADFNVSTHIRRRTSESGENEWILPTSRSGSPLYMAPEVHLARPYDFSVDWWSLGVVMWECVYGWRPFGGNSSNAVAQAIHGIPPGDVRAYNEYIGRYHSAIALSSSENEVDCANPPSADSGLPRQPVTEPAVTQQCQWAISSFLQRRPSARLGSVSVPLHQHSFFRDLDWPHLRQGRSAPPFRPGSKNNFDTTWELESVLLDEAIPASSDAWTRQRSKQAVSPSSTKTSRATMLHQGQDGSSLGAALAAIGAAAGRRRSSSPAHQADPDSGERTTRRDSSNAPTDQRGLLNLLECYFKDYIAPPDECVYNARSGDGPDPQALPVETARVSGGSMRRFCERNSSDGSASPRTMAAQLGETPLAPPEKDGRTAPGEVFKRGKTLTTRFSTTSLRHATTSAARPVGGSGGKKDKHVVVPGVLSFKPGGRIAVAQSSEVRSASID